MNLATIADLYSGGPGSGCHGPNCGRNAGEWEAELTKMGILHPNPTPLASTMHSTPTVRYEISKYAKRAPISTTPLQPSSKSVATYQQSTATNVKTTGTKWMASPHNFKGYFHVSTKSTNPVMHSHTAIIEGPGKSGGGTIVTVTHHMKMLGAPVDRVHVKEQDTDDIGSIWRTRSRQFVRVKDGLSQINNRYGVQL